MRDFWKFLAFPMTGFLVFACSSSTRISTPNGDGNAPVGGSNVQCRSLLLRNINLASRGNQDCDECLATLCLLERSAYIGVNPDAFEGACGESLDCLCQCTDANLACATTCLRKLADDSVCASASNQLNACGRSRCGSVCPSGRGGLSDAGTQ
jgi:hypothetical protein